MSCLSYSQDSQFIATGGSDGKVKLWSTQSGFCFVTFTEHSAAVTALEFAKKKQIVFSASLDGTVRAFDMIRYRNFRTFTSPRPEQFASVAIDSTAEIVCAGSSDTFEIYMWSVQTGQLLDIISGHEGPVSSLEFSPFTGQLASGSWDKTIRIWDVYARDKAAETLEHQAEVLAIMFSPDGQTIGSTTMDGTICFWNVEAGSLVSEIQGRRDIAMGRKEKDQMTAANAAGKFFNSLCFTSDGKGVIAGSNSKYVCIYDVRSSMLLKRFQITSNQSLDGMNEFLNSKNVTEAGPMSRIDREGENIDLQDRIDKSLPGVKSGDLSQRSTRPEARTSMVKFSPSGRAWAAACTEGLMIYSLDNHIQFDPFDLEINITPTLIHQTVSSGDFLKAMVMAFRLGEQDVISNVYQSIPVSEISLIVRQIPTKYLARTIGFLTETMETSPKIQQCLLWMVALFKHHSDFLRERNMEYAASLTGMSKVLTHNYTDMSRV